MRVGHGIDVHAFAAGRPLLLGGVPIPHSRGLAGHSDADVVLHALIDALLGGAALGDIGGMFPSDDARWRDAGSLDLLAAAYAHVRERGLALVNADIVVIAAEPRLAPHVAAMRGAIAAALAVEPACVSVKATTTDGLGFTGRGEGIAASATVLLQ